MGKVLTTSSIGQVMVDRHCVPMFTGVNIPLYKSYWKQVETKPSAGGLETHFTYPRQSAVLRYGHINSFVQTTRVNLVGAVSLSPCVCFPTEPIKHDTNHVLTSGCCLFLIAPIDRIIFLELGFCLEFIIMQNTWSSPSGALLLYLTATTHPKGVKFWELLFSYIYLYKFNLLE